MEQNAPPTPHLPLSPAPPHSTSFCCLVELKFKQPGRGIAGTRSLMALRWVTVVIKVSKSKHNLPDLHTFLLATPNNLTNHCEKARWPQDRRFADGERQLESFLKPTLGWNYMSISWKCGLIYLKIEIKGAHILPQQRCSAASVCRDSLASYKCKWARFICQYDPPPPCSQHP